MTIAVTELRSIPVQDIIEEQGIDFAIEIKEATFTTSTGCGASFSVEEFELSSYDNFSSDSVYNDHIDPVVVEREDVEESMTEDEVKLEVDTALEGLRKELEREELITKRLKRDLVIAYETIANLRKHWWNRPPWNFKVF